MDFKEAIARQIAEHEKSKSQSASDFDAWDQAAIDYLVNIKTQLDQGTSPQDIYQHLTNELAELQERVESEESIPTFDWYDDHYYLKIYSGQMQACQKALALYEASVPSREEPPTA